MEVCNGSVQWRCVVEVCNRGVQWSVLFFFFLYLVRCSAHGRFFARLRLYIPLGV